MSAAARDAQWISRLHGLGRAGNVGAEQFPAVALFGERLLARRARRRGHDLPLRPGAFRLVENARDERDDVARPADQHSVADLDAAGADHLLVGQRRAGDRGPAHEDRLQPRDRGDLAGFADVPDHIGQYGGLLLGGELVRQCPARRTRTGACGGIRGAVGEPEDGAVDVVVQVVALLLDRGDDGLRGGRVGATAHVRGGEAERQQTAAQVGFRTARFSVQVEGEKAQPTLGDRGWVFRAQRARRGVAGVDQRLVRVCGVVGGEGRPQHHCLAAHLDPAWGADLVRNAVGQGAHEHGHVVAGGSVAAGDRSRQAAVLVHQGQRQAVELGHHDHGLPGEPVEESLDLLRLRRLLQRQHRPRMPDRRVQHRGPAHLVQRVRVRGQLRARLDQPAQLVLDRVVLRVRHHRRTPVVRVAQHYDLIGQLLNTFPNVHGPERYPAPPTKPDCDANRAVAAGLPIG